MKLSHLFNTDLILQEAKARIEHPEDMILDQGVPGAHTALQILQATADKPQQVSVKYDGCIHPDTVLLTSNGEMTIKELIDCGTSVDVLTHNFDTNQDEYNPAQYPRINHNNKKWVKIYLENNESLTLTEDHEVFVEGKGWTQTKNLSPSDDIKEFKK
jgi:hypothetical protein